MGVCADHIWCRQISTTTANEIVKPVHPSHMVVILAPKDYGTWLHGTADEALALLRPYPVDKMRIVQQGVGVLSDDGAGKRLSAEPSR
ncbi:MAG: SOS response-associated peptidase family protein [Sulfitobacter sp.]